MMNNCWSPCYHGVPFGGAGAAVNSGILDGERRGAEMKGAIVFLLGILLLGAPGAAAKDVRFPRIAGWQLSAEIQRFEPKTLYEYINGAADLYLACGFEELKVAEYGNGQKASVIVELYRQRTSRDAFGIYSQERLPEAAVLPVGAEGYIAVNILNFVAGRYYVKISSANTGAEDREVLRRFAGSMAAELGEAGGLPAPLALFPAEGKRVNSEKYIARNFLGYPFFSGVFTADYEIAGRKFRLFISEAKDENECRETVRNYLRQTKTPDRGAAEGRQAITDPHHGIVDLSWKGRYLWGAVDLADADLRSRYLRQIEARLGD